ncbi:hypothetical protein [Corynebacterium sp.]|uniref:hypothetical protein n=1 Tax=unclassified Corynebacterium TaxID=2624378 RepID=UPI0027BA9D14|nr:hypothetical protein [Corynebacterium sp.]
MSSAQTGGRKKSLFAALAFLVVAIVSVVVGRGGISLPSFSSSDSSTPPREHVFVKGAISPESEEFFKYATESDVFTVLGISVDYDVVSPQDMMEIASSPSSDYDFVMPALDGAARAVEAEDKSTTMTDADSGSVVAFSTPLIALVYTDLVDDMQAKGLVADSGGNKSLDLAKLNEMSKDGTRWRDISPDFGSPRVVDVAVPSVRESSAALQYASLIRTVGKDTGGDDAMQRLLVGQGHGETSTQGIFDAFLRLGQGEMPMVLATEAELVAELFQQSISESGTRLEEYTPLTLDPGALLTFTVVPQTEEGEAFAAAVREASFQGAAAVQGYRTEPSSVFENFATEIDYAPLDLPTQQRPTPWRDYEAILQELG